MPNDGVSSAVEPDHSAPVLSMHDVTAAYGRIQVLHGVTFEVAAGSVVALLGPNGAGKTTALKVASGQMRPTSGDVRVLGRSIAGAAPHRLVRAGICTVPEGRGVFPNLTVTENLKMVTYSGSAFRDVLDVAFAQFPRLKERRSQLAGTMSGGEQQMLAMARALASDPAVLLLDELSMGLAPLIVDELYDVVARIASTGVSILVVEQFARTVLKVAHHAVLMVHGKVVGEGPPAELEQRLSELYLGAGA